MRYAMCVPSYQFSDLFTIGKLLDFFAPDSCFEMPKTASCIVGCRQHSRWYSQPQSLMRRHGSRWEPSTSQRKKSAVAPDTKISRHRIRHDLTPRGYCGS